MSKPLSLKAAMQFQKCNLVPPGPIHSDHLKAKSWAQRMAMEEAKTRNRSMEGIQDNPGLLEGGSGSEAGGKER